MQRFEDFFNASLYFVFGGKYDANLVKIYDSVGNKLLEWDDIEDNPIECSKYMMSSFSLEKRVLTGKLYLDNEHFETIIFDIKNNKYTIIDCTGPLA